MPGFLVGGPEVSKLLWTEVSSTAHIHGCLSGMLQEWN